MLTAKEQQLLDALSPKAESEQVEIVTVEVVGASKAPTIRVFIDTEDGVSFDVLSSAQAWINDIMDELDPFPGAYTLEVSSPGIDRPLRTREHFERFAGENVSVKTAGKIEGRSTFSGKLCGIDGDDVLVDVDGQRMRVPFNAIKRARIKGTINFNS
ncbi:ribosome maturation factor RimP [Adlercreutzia sp. ZJ141]|uniref:ribosome maturation factor RimP n=1 Tax=Adlercreutzia sp. ZJ141 TaxID=2709406 RepID=UPI0013ECAFFA|nr:ribosome maturation factor RimP [Adlercreutzia sp. ZJ141]